MRDMKVKGLKRLTKPFSEPVQTDKGGKTVSKDTSKKRLYKVVGET